MLFCFYLQSCFADTARPSPKGKSPLSVNCLIDLASAFLPEHLSLGVWCPHPSLQKNNAVGVFCRLWHCAVLSPPCLCGDQNLWKQVWKCQYVDLGLSLVSWDSSAEDELALVSFYLRGSWVKRFLGGSLLDLAFLIPLESVCWPCLLNERLVFISPSLCPLARDSNLVPWSDTPYVWTASPSHTECKALGYKVLLWLQVDASQAWEMDPDQNNRGPLALPCIFPLIMLLPTMGSKPQARLYLSFLLLRT